MDIKVCCFFLLTLLDVMNTKKKMRFQSSTAASITMMVAVVVVIIVKRHASVQRENVRAASLHQTVFSHNTKRKEHYVQSFAFSLPLAPIGRKRNGYGRCKKIRK